MKLRSRLLALVAGLVAVLLPTPAAAQGGGSGGGCLQECATDGLCWYTGATNHLCIQEIRGNEWSCSGWIGPCGKTLTGETECEVAAKAQAVDAVGGFFNAQTLTALYEQGDEAFTRQVRLIAPAGRAPDPVRSTE